MNPKQQALHKAKARLLTRRDHYICHALYMVSQHHPDLAPACAELRWQIEHELGDHDTLSQWVSASGYPGIMESPMYDSDFPRLARLAWIDKLLANEATIT